MRVYAATGNPAEHLTRDPSLSSIGAVYACYELLERVGFAFLHPLQPFVPGNITLPASDLTVAQKPYWEHRGFHIHTEHPLELTDVLQGMDTPSETWASMLPDVDFFFEWCAANKINRVEWVLLYAPKWADFASSKLRQDRFRQINALAHAYGIATGADVPIAVRQQHAWYMVDPSTQTMPQMIASIQNRTDWLMAAGYDFMSTESGFSEFTHPDDHVMLTLMNTLADYTRTQYNRECYIKIHCSTRQFCTNYKDPRTGEPLNFNFLPMYATENMGIMPHTVQSYAFSDPAPVYGNNNFEYMRDFLYYQAKTSKRPVVYHGETNYWVNVDIDVPIFLPLTGERRLQDLREIAAEEQRGNFKMSGQMNFDSGWEWGAFVSEVVTARAAWDPLMTVRNQTEAFRLSLAPVVRPFGAAAARVTALLMRYVEAQKALLIHGQYAGTKPPQVDLLNGFAYLSGRDTWTDLPSLLNISLTQPQRIGFKDTKHPLYAHVAPLLTAMASTFSTLYSEFVALRAEVPAAALPLFDDMLDTAHMTALRATHTRTLYLAAAPGTSASERDVLLNASLVTIAAAQHVVAQRESAYRVQVSRIASWRESPTAYHFGYLWTVHSLYYFWRDYGLVKGGSLEALLSPCYLNLMNAFDIALSDYGDVAELIKRVLALLPGGVLLGDCLAPPEQEFVFPRDLFLH